MFLPHILPAPDPSVMRAVPGTASKSNQSPPNPRFTAGVASSHLELVDAMNTHLDSFGRRRRTRSIWSVLLTPR